MKIRNSYRKILLAVLVTGVLLCGIGTGIAISEYSSFEYLGEKEIGGDTVQTDTFEETLYRGENDDTKVNVQSYGSDGQKMTLETSKTDIHIDKEEYMEYDDYTAEHGTPPNCLYITYYVNPVTVDQNEFTSFMNYKDEILQNLKEKRFYNYTYQTIQSVKVVVNPENKDVVELSY